MHCCSNERIEYSSHDWSTLTRLLCVLWHSSNSSVVGKGGSEGTNEVTNAPLEQTFTGAVAAPGCPNWSPTEPFNSHLSLLAPFDLHCFVLEALKLQYYQPEMTTFSGLCVGKQFYQNTHNRNYFWKDSASQSNATLDCLWVLSEDGLIELVQYIY